MFSCLPRRVARSVRVMPGSLTPGEQPRRKCRGGRRRAIRFPFGFVMNRRATSKAARKPPQQSRSRVTVSTILDAAVRVMDREGPDAATTTRIAEVAGVSVGTLYQYFGNRDSILDALQDREFE